MIQHIDLLNDTKDNHVKIFNRWGDMVWDGENYNNKTVLFTGVNLNGDDLPTGTYFYQIQFSGKHKGESGYLSLKR